jgi:prepilin-type N-terminal cleavage/methylation domain-containing protein
MQLHRISIDKKGFTMIELLVVISIMGLIFGMGLFASFDFYRSYLLSTERDILLGVLEKARSRAMANMFESSHGVHIENSTYVIFRGDSYIPGAASNEEIPGNSIIQKSGINDVVFEELTGLPSVTGSISLLEGANSKIISINYEGRIDW